MTAGIDVSFDFTEVNALAVELNTLALSSAPLARAAVRKSTLDTEVDAKIFCPVDTGFLENSIGSEFRGNAYFSEGICGPTANYGRFVNDGTSRMAPQPYMDPAHLRQVPPFMAAMEYIAGRL